jgi:hypothetical protein
MALRAAGPISWHYLVSPVIHAEEFELGEQLSDAAHER